MYVSRHLINNINHFGKCGGFSKFLDVIEKPDTSLAFVRSYMKALVEVNIFFVENFNIYLTHLTRLFLITILLFQSHTFLN